MDFKPPVPIAYDTEAGDFSSRSLPAPSFAYTHVHSSSVVERVFSFPPNSFTYLWFC